MESQLGGCLGIVPVLSIYFRLIIYQLSPDTCEANPTHCPHSLLFVQSVVPRALRRSTSPTMAFTTYNFSRRIAPISLAALWFFTFAASVLLFHSPEVSGSPHKHSINSHWLPATATWYGSPEGDGSNGGACGYGSLVDVKPLRARVGAVSPILFKGGEGCGACYKVKCLDKSICSRRAVTVIITDECPGGYCSGGNTHFDLSGAAFGRMAVAGDHNHLRDRGLLNIVYRRTPCKYPGRNVAFHVNEGSTNYWLSLLVEFEGGDGDVGSMHIREAKSTEWLEMSHVWGANWVIVRGPLRGPFSVKLTTLSSGRTLSARDVIPSNWAVKATYTSRLNFSP